MFLEKQSNASVFSVGNFTGREGGDNVGCSCPCGHPGVDVGNYAEQHGVLVPM